MRRIRAVLFLALFVTCPLACAGGTAVDSVSDVRFPPECESFLTVYRASLQTLGPENVALARTAQTRTSLEQEFARGGPGRARLKNLCTNQLETLARK
jgi:hypothetical protein